MKEKYREQLRREGYLIKEELVVGRQYICHARNFIVGTWTGERFSYIRCKYNTFFEDAEYHYDDGPPHGTVRPLELVEL